MILKKKLIFLHFTKIYVKIDLYYFLTNYKMEKKQAIETYKLARNSQDWKEFVQTMKEAFKKKDADSLKKLAENTRVFQLKQEYNNLVPITKEELSSLKKILWVTGWVPTVIKALYAKTWVKNPKDEMLEATKTPQTSEIKDTAFDKPIENINKSTNEIQEPVVDKETYKEQVKDIRENIKKLEFGEDELLKTLWVDVSNPNYVNTPEYRWLKEFDKKDGKYVVTINNVERKIEKNANWKYIVTFDLNDDSIFWDKEENQNSQAELKTLTATDAEIKAAVIIAIKDAIDKKSIIDNKDTKEIEEDKAENLKKYVRNLKINWDVLLKYLWVDITKPDYINTPEYKWLEEFWKNWLKNEVTINQVEWRHIKKQSNWKYSVIFDFNDDTSWWDEDYNENAKITLDSNDIDERTVRFAVIESAKKSIEAKALKDGNTFKQEKKVEVKNENIDQQKAS